MRKRPLVVTVIAWGVIVLGCLSLAGAMHGLLSWWEVPRSPEQMRNLAQGFLSAGITVACGGFLLRGANGARWFYLAWMVFQWVLFLRASPSFSWLIALNAAITVGILACLFNPQANAYFRPRPLPEA